MRGLFINILMLTMTTFYYTASDGDTVQSIAEKFCDGNNPRQVLEFREGIRELNYDILRNEEIQKGMVIQINKFRGDQDE